MNTTINMHTMPTRISNKDTGEKSLVIAVHEYNTATGKRFRSKMIVMPEMGRLPNVRK